MKCPYCSNEEDKVIESRTINDGEAVRRRRECLQCGERFTSYERVEPKAVYVIKKDGRREPYDRNKILKGITRAVEKRPISMETVNAILDKIESRIPYSAESEVSTQFIGNVVMEELEKLDPVAYVRFASVYREFQTIREFVQEIKALG